MRKPTSRIRRDLTAVAAHIKAARDAAANGTPDAALDIELWLVAADKYLDDLHAALNPSGPTHL